jgi:2-methylcitrate dehydratase PrpD
VASTSGRDIITAFALGLELCLRIGRARYDTKARTSRFLERGQDSSAICGAVAGSAVAAKLLGLDAVRIANAIGIAVSLASGSLESNRSGGTVKSFQSGWAAKSAVQAACLAKYGVNGPIQAFEGRYGFYRCFVDGKFDTATLSSDLGSRWEIENLRFKPYPSIPIRTRASTQGSHWLGRDCDPSKCSQRSSPSPPPCCTLWASR